MPWLIVAHAAALLCWVLFTEWEIRYNAQRIHLDLQAGQDSLRKKFHRQRLTIRAIVAAGLVIGASLPIAEHPWQMFVAVVSLALCFGGWFGYRFNSGLNKARGLAPWYVSFTPWASAFDQYFANKTRRKFADHVANMKEDAKARYLLTRAGCALRNAMRMGLGFGLLIEVVNLIVCHFLTR